MGTSGHRVWRHRKIYRVQYKSHDSYPSGLGLSMLREIPNGKEFMEWVEKWRSWFDSDYETWLRDTGGVWNEYDTGFWFQTERPRNIEFWTYEIDLDHLVFHVNCQPLFRLDCMPDEKTFLESIGLDSYGLAHYDITTPEQHRYESVLAERALPVAEDFLQNYRTLEPKVDSPSGVLRIPVTDTPHTRVTELIVSRVVFRRHEIFEWRAASCQEDIEEISSFAYSLLVFCIWPKLTSGSTIEFEIDPPRDGLDDGYWWLTARLCVRLVPQLQDEDTMKAAIADVAEVIALKNTNSTTFGVLFNVLHICILRVSHKDNERVVEHTHALPFLPPFLATSPQTAGISALVALSQVLYRDMLLMQIKPASTGLPPLLAKLPLELFDIICHHLNVDSLVNLASISHESFGRCLRLLKLPYMMGYRLSASKRVKDEALTKEELKKPSEYRKSPLPGLQYARFRIDMPVVCDTSLMLRLRVKHFDYLTSVCLLFFPGEPGEDEGTLTYAHPRYSIV